MQILRYTLLALGSATLLSSCAMTDPEGTSEFTITSEPTGAGVTVKNDLNLETKLPNAPATVEVPRGATLKVMVYKAGYETFETEVAPRSVRGGHDPLHVVLKKK